MLGATRGEGWKERRGSLLARSPGSPPPPQPVSDQPGCWSPFHQIEGTVIRWIMPLLSRRAREKGDPRPPGSAEGIGWSRSRGRVLAPWHKDCLLPQTRKDGEGPSGKRPVWGARGSLGGSAPPALDLPAELLRTCAHESVLESKEWVSPNPLITPSLRP